MFCHNRLVVGYAIHDKNTSLFVGRFHVHRVRAVWFIPVNPYRSVKTPHPLTLGGHLCPTYPRYHNTGQTLAKWWAISLLSRIGMVQLLRCERSEHRI